MWTREKCTPFSRLSTSRSWQQKKKQKWDWVGRKGASFKNLIENKATHDKEMGKSVKETWSGWKDKESNTETMKTMKEWREYS